MNAAFELSHLPGLLPVLIIVLGALGALLMAPGVGEWGGSRRGVGYLTLLTLGAALITQAVVWKLQPAAVSLLGGALSADPYSHIFCLLFIGAGIFSALVFSDFLDAQDIGGAEPYVLLLLSVAGMMLMSMATELMALFVALEIMSLAIYVLAGVRRHDPRSSEAALKYFLLGAFGSAILLYGVALIYGNAGGSTQLEQIGEAVRAVGDPRKDAPLLLLGIGLVVIGFAFKIAAVPLHMWTPDVYEGAPTAVTGIMAVGVKAAGFAAFGRFLLEVVGPGAGSAAEATATQQALLVMAVLTMLVGNLGAMVQTNVKRILAFSSIAHTGYAMLGLAAVLSNGAGSFTGIIFYLLAYGVMTIGAFAIAGALERGGRHVDQVGQTLDSYAGLARRHPGLALAFAVFLFSLAGIPPTAGFFGKLYVFYDAVKAGLTGWVIVGLLNSVLGAFYYLRIVVAIYMEENAGQATAELRAPAPFTLVAVVACALLTLILGLFPISYVEPAAQIFEALAQR